MELFYYPPALIESLFSNVDNLGEFDEEKLGHIRIYQFPFISYEFLLDYDKNLTEKENFKLRIGAGRVYNLGGRKFGKTVFTEELDLLVSAILLENEPIGFSSYDAVHIRGVLEKIVQAFENHPFLQILDAQINRSPTYRIYCKNGVEIESVNMNLQSKSPGSQFFQKHFKRLYIEEWSFETEEINKKRAESISEDGCIDRFSGMTNFTKHSPVGAIFNNLALKSWIINLPQYVSPKWDAEAKAEAIKKHSGESTISYKTFVKGEVTEEGISVFDMSRIRPQYIENRITKHFEINTNNFLNFKDIIILDKPVQTTATYVNSDIGESAPSEIIILFEVNKKYRYTYNITLYNLTDKQQTQIFEYIIEKIGLNFLAIDTTEGTGRAIFRNLEEKYGREHLVWVNFAEKIPVDFDKDDLGNILFKDGKPLFKEEYITDWSIKRLKDLLYEFRIELGLDYKFDVQFNSVISMLSGNRVIYECVSEEDHLLAAFRAFAIAQWMNEFNLIKPLVKKAFAKTGV